MEGLIGAESQHYPFQVHIPTCLLQLTVPTRVYRVARKPDVGVSIALVSCCSGLWRLVVQLVPLLSVSSLSASSIALAASKEELPDSELVAVCRPQRGVL
eukprot:4299182-Amphidinium_carterae.1